MYAMISTGTGLREGLQLSLTEFALQYDRVPAGCPMSLQPGVQQGYLNDGHFLVQVRVHWVTANQLRADVYV